MRFIALAFLAAALAFADAPTINIVSPNSATPLIINMFPYESSINLGITHSGGLKNVKNLTVTVGGVNVISMVGSLYGENPVQQGGQTYCHNDLLNTTGITGCSVTSGTSGTVTVRWIIPSAGSYVIQVAVQHTNDIGRDEETVSVAVASISYPAPPAVANAFINSNLKTSAPKVRGCVLNQIAENHAKSQKYNPAPGPYNEQLIQQDVLNYWPGCGGVVPNQ